MLKPSGYVLLLVLVSTAAFGYRLRTGIFACPAAGEGDGELYLAYCHGETYGDYDHGAFWFGLEPAVRDNAAQADVLFLGSSRLQFAFSTGATSAWFQARSLRHYLLGFGYTESVTFVAPLVARLGPHASAYVINVDRFFTDNESPPGAEILHGEDVALRKYEDKRRWQRAHDTACGAVGALCGDELAFFRRPGDGHWRVGGHAQGGVAFVPADVSDGPPGDTGRWDAFAAIADRFVRALPVDRRCVTLTLVPYAGTRRAEAEAIARALGTDLVTPAVSDLRTFDGSHLDEASAERWSAAFFEMAGPRIEPCTARAKSASAARGIDR